MSVVMNLPCPECQKNGADKRGQYLMVFEDGGKLCIHTHNHDSRERYYVAPDGKDPVFDREIDGKVQYNAAQFNQLVADGKIKDEFTRQLALSGMRMKDRYEVFTEEERNQIEAEWAMDVAWFEQLSYRSLEDRAIHGAIAKFYDVRVGHDEHGKINRHYYPVHTREDMSLVGAKARTLPKDFAFGHLGRRFGDDLALFGMHTTQKVMDSGTFRKGKMGKLLVVGGECDAMAAQQMLVKSINKLDTLQGIKSLDGLKLVHVWSPTKGETCLDEIVANREYLDAFEEIVWGFDNDDVGNKLNLACAKLFRQKSKFIVYPSGCKDANQCLKEGRDKEFVDAWWQPVEARVKGKLKAASSYADIAKKITKNGLSYFIPELNPITFGVRLSYLGVWGAGTGVGKTEMTTSHICKLIEQGKPVVAIYLENSPDEVLKMVASRIANKDFMSPPYDPDDPDDVYSASRDYTWQELSDTIDALVASNLLFIPELEGSKDVTVIMEVMEDALALGYQYFVVDNLTAFEHHVDGKVQVGVNAIDETMKRMGTFKDEHPVNIMLLTHLTRPEKGRIPHELGGEVFITDFRGAGSISFWANGAWGIERNTQAASIQDKCTTLIRNLKSRGVGHKVGNTVVIRKILDTGEYEVLDGVHELPQVGREKKDKQSSASRQMADNFIDEADEEF
ncbi:DNA primase/helicase [Klebsiella phage 6939]|uniref:DNA primase/helicase n=1 Tax=Klebsiella phage 6939 TaxID=2912295 RepID=A0A9E7M7G9_9CAUD|nr:DNA primase/helicase [Klebsiella phage 6939]